jgi:hypothetical protein
VHVLVPSTEFLRFCGEKSVHEFVPPTTRKVPRTVHGPGTQRAPAAGGHIYLAAVQDGAPMPMNQVHLEMF